MNLSLREKRLLAEQVYLKAMIKAEQAKLRFFTAKIAELQERVS